MCETTNDNKGACRRVCHRATERHWEEACRDCGRGASEMGDRPPKNVRRGGCILEHRPAEEQRAVAFVEPCEKHHGLAFLLKMDAVNAGRLRQHGGTVVFHRGNAQRPILDVPQT